MMKFLAGWKKPLVMALFALIVAPHVAFGHPAKLTRPVWVMPAATATWTTVHPMPMPPWAAN